jgi:hypothetical protein
MRTVPVLPDDVFGKIISFADAKTLVTLKKVSKNIRVLVKYNVQKRWRWWLSKAKRPSKSALELGKSLDCKLFEDICTGKDRISYAAREESERNWLHVR